MLIDSLKGFRIVGVCSGHRHSMVLDEHGCLYTFGSGASGALGHGDLIGQEYPMKVMEFGKIHKCMVVVTSYDIFHLTLICFCSFV